MCCVSPLVAAPESKRMSEGSIAVHRVDPLKDARWDEFVRRHPHSSVFHSSAWLRALQRSYLYEPFVLTASAPGEDLDNGIAFCRIESFVTGRRAISLPFSDHCEPLVSAQEMLEPLLNSVTAYFRSENLRYIEMRPLTSPQSMACFRGFRQFWWHTVDLRRDPADIFRALHKDCVQRKIRRAERESLLEESGRSEHLLAKFYDLLVLTRRRHGLVPQPITWFRHLIGCFGDALTIRVVSKGGRPVAAILTLRHKSVIVYKYGCSDPSCYQLGGVQYLLWRTIQDAHHQGIRELDLGRTDYDDSGLAQFKDRWGSTRSTLTYWRTSTQGGAATSRSSIVRTARVLLPHMPDTVLTALGRILYRHIG